MTTNLDLLIVAVMAIAALGLLALTLMLLLKNPRWKRICLYLTSILGLYLSYVAFRINWPGFPLQCIAAGVLAVCATAALFLGRKEPNAPAQALAAASLVLGFCNAFA